MKKLSPIAKAHIAAAAKARWAKIKAAHPGSTKAVAVLPPIKCANAAHLISGNDAAAAKQLNKLFTEAQNGMRRVVALGLFAWVTDAPAYLQHEPSTCNNCHVMDAQYEN